MNTKSLLLDIKAAPDESEDSSGQGQFTGYASVFGNVDSYGDVVQPGAFTDSLDAFGEGGAGIPCYWSHDMSDPMKCIGETTSAVEDEKGLLVTVQLDLDNPNGAQAYKLIQRGLVRQMSFAFEVQSEEPASDEELGDHNRLNQLKIFEVSLVQVGANQQTELLDVKDRLSGVKAGRKISATNEDKLNQAQQLISDVLASVQSEAEDDGQATESSDEEPKQVKSEEPETVKDEEPVEVKSRTLSAADIAEIEITLLKGA